MRKARVFPTFRHNLRTTSEIVRAWAHFLHELFAVDHVVQVALLDGRPGVLVLPGQDGCVYSLFSGKV